VVGRDESLALVVNLRVPNWADRVIEALKRRLLSRPRFRATAFERYASGSGARALLQEAARDVEAIAPHELFSDPSPYLFALFAPTAHERCTLTSPAKARHVLRVHRARRGTTELIFEDRTLARALHRVLARPDGIYGAALLEQFGGDGQDLGRALKMLVTAGLLARSTE